MALTVVFLKEKKLSDGRNTVSERDQATQNQDATAGVDNTSAALLASLRPPELANANLRLLSDASHTASTERGFAGSAADSFLYNGFQMPVNGVVQIADKVAGTDMMSRVQLVDAPAPAEFGSSAWFGQNFGGTVGAALPFVAMYRVAGPGAGAKLELSAAYGLNRAALPAIGRSAVAGAAFSGIFQPIPEGTDFVRGRVNNMVVGGLTMATLTSGTIGLKSTGLRFLGNDAVAGALSGAPAGMVGINLHSVLEGKGLATVNQNIEAASTFSLAGAFMGSANTVHEMIKPTSGVRGVRTWYQMSEMADATRAPGWENFSSRAKFAEPHHATTGSLYQDTVRVLQSRPHPYTQEQISRLARVKQDMAFSMREIEPLRPVVTIYGSARTPETHFGYQRTRYLAGELAKDGWSVMTGGGERGIMRAGNQGAFQAGGKSIGVNIELPFETRPNEFQTNSVTHDIFSSRKDALRLTDAAVFEIPGFGTLDECMELLTLIQTGKQQRIPIFFMGRENYGAVERVFQGMLRARTISPNDMHLFKIVEDPRQVVRELGAYRASRLAAAPNEQPLPAPQTGLRPATH